MGIRVFRNDRGIHLSQPEFITKLENIFCEELPQKVMKSPIGRGFDPLAKSEMFHQTRYSSLVGALQWLMSTRPDIGSSVSMLSRFISNPTRNLWRCALSVLKYLVDTKQHGNHIYKIQRIEHNHVNRFKLGISSRWKIYIWLSCNGLWTFGI